MMKLIISSMLVAFGMIEIFSMNSHAALLKAPPGVIFPFAGATCPAGSIAADHSNLLRAGKYSGLFVALGGASTAWGVADGSHFYSPDLRERSLKGTGTTSDGNGGTTITLGTYQADTTAKNGLTITDPGHTHNAQLGSGSGPPYINANLGNASVATSVTSSNTTGITLNAGDTETRIKAYGVLFCIWY